MPAAFTISQRFPKIGTFITLLFIGCVSAVGATYFELFHEEVLSYYNGPSAGLLTGVITLHDLLFILISWLILFCICWLLCFHGHRFFHTLFRFRFLIGAIFIALCVLFDLSGSSIAMWATVTGSDPQTANTIFGIPRAIRSDEWLVSTPYAFAQATEGFPMVSDLIRGGNTDVTLTCASPCWALATLFRPYFWGYLLFGAAKGLAWFWSVRLVALLLICFECGRLITRDNRYLSAALALLVAFSPIVQWWFSVIAEVELLIFGGALVLLLNAFLHTQSIRNKVIFSFLMAWCAGCFLFVVYPAWEVPLFFVYAGMGLWIVLAYRKERAALASSQRKSTLSLRYSLLPLCTAIGILIICAVLIFLGAKDALIATASTDYPGARVSSGGGLGLSLFNYGSSLFSAITPENAIPNSCEQSAFFCLFPVGTLLGIYFSIKKKDPFCIILLVEQALFLIYGLVGLPDWLASITLLNKTTTGRIPLAIGLIEILLLVRSATLMQHLCPTAPAMRKHCSAIVAIAFIIAFAGCLSISTAQFSKIEFVLFVVTMILALYALISIIYAEPRKQEKPDQSATPASHPLPTIHGQHSHLPQASLNLCIFALCIIALSGLCVNPIQRGTAVATDNNVVHTVEDQGGTDTRWITDTNIQGQLCLIAGQQAINSVNAYPNLALWESLDPTDSQRSTYNRYAHINTDIQNGDTSFELVRPDAFTIHLKVDDLQKIGANRILTTKNIDDLSTDQTSLTQIAQEGQFRIYAVEQR